MAHIIDMADAKRERRLRERQARVISEVAEQVVALVAPADDPVIWRDEDMRALHELIGERVLALRPDLFRDDIFLTEETA